MQEEIDILRKKVSSKEEEWKDFHDTVKNFMSKEMKWEDHAQDKDKVRCKGRKLEDSVISKLLMIKN